MKEKSLINGCKIELRLEQHYHSAMLKEAKTDEDKVQERLRHEEALKDICDTYDKKIKQFKELGILEK